MLLEIGNGLSPDEIETRTSIHAIRAKFQNVTPFDFNPITNERVKTFIGMSSSKKATGVDGKKIIKSCTDTISEALSTLINFSIANSKFPNRLKEAQVIPIFKSFIASNFNYCPLIWHFCSQSNTNKLENIQKRALRFIYNNYTSSHADLLRSCWHRISAH